MLESTPKPTTKDASFKVSLNVDLTFSHIAYFTDAEGYKYKEFAAYLGTERIGDFYTYDGTWDICGNGRGRFFDNYDERTIKKEKMTAANLQVVIKQIVEAKIRQQIMWCEVGYMVRTRGDEFLT